MAKLSLAAMEKFLKEAGAKRVSNEAKKAFAEALSDVAADLAAEAVKLSKHAGRRTVKRSDVQLAAKSL